jgi:hypothetical protein
MDQRLAEVIRRRGVEDVLPGGSGDRVLDRRAGLIEGDQKILA